MSCNYYPILRWKQGEQIAVAKLDVADRAALVPIAEVQALETGGQPKLEKTLRAARADVYPIAVDIKPCYLGTRVPLARLARIVGRFHTAGLDVWPVVHAADAFADVAGLPAFKGQRALVLRIYPNDTPLVSALAIAKDVRKAMGRGGRLHVVIDLDSIGDIDPAAMAAMTVPYVRDLTASGDVSRVVMAGGSFPLTVGGFKLGVGNLLPRRELTIWKAVRGHAGCQDAAFGDYGVTNPQPLEPIDPRTMNPSAHIRYTLRNEWWLLRASGVKTKGWGQYNDLCMLLVADPRYSGATFSFGDDRYTAHSVVGSTSGSFMTWRRDATSHHLVFTVRQLAAGNY
jgi:hypothetical protein